jgi:hypothetical protein
MAESTIAIEIACTATKMNASRTPARRRRSAPRRPERPGHSVPGNTCSSKRIPMQARDRERDHDPVREAGVHVRSEEEAERDRRDGAADAVQRLNLDDQPEHADREQMPLTSGLVAKRASNSPQVYDRVLDACRDVRRAQARPRASARSRRRCARAWLRRRSARGSRPRPYRPARRRSCRPSPPRARRVAVVAGGGRGEFGAQRGHVLGVVRNRLGRADARARAP